MASGSVGDKFEFLILHNLFELWIFADESIKDIILRNIHMFVIDIMVGFSIGSYFREMGIRAFFTFLCFGADSE